MDGHIVTFKIIRAEFQQKEATVTVAGCVNLISKDIVESCFKGVSGIMIKHLVTRLLLRNLQ